MKHKIYALAVFAICLSLTGCTYEEDDIFDNSAAERLIIGAEEAAARLTSSPAGWVMEYYPTEDSVEDPQGLGYLICSKFSTNGSVLVGMKNQFSGDVYKEDTSAWGIVTDTGIVLSYNTYNQCMHAFSDPADISFTDSSETGKGCEGDYEFIFVSIPEEENPEYLMLKGKKRGVYIRTTRLAEGTDFQEYIEDVQAFSNNIFTSSAPNYLVFTIGTDQLQAEDMSTGIPNIYKLGGDAISDEARYPYCVSQHEGKYYLRFRDAIETINGFAAQEFVYDEGEDAFIDVEDSNNTFTGPDPLYFFLDEWDKTRGWQVRRTSDMSDAAYEIFDAMYSGLSAMRYTLQYVRFTQSEDEILATLNIRASSGASTTISYNFSVNTTDTTVNLSYIGPTTTASETVATSVPEVVTFLQSLCGGFSVSAPGSRFNLSDLTLTSSSNSNIWYTFSLN